jgi:hypothetical protein
LRNGESKLPFEPQPIYNTEDESSEETEEEFDWYEPDKHEKESYFVLTNLQRRTLQPGEQAFYCYGNRSNKFLLKNYGFCYMGNRYDSYVVKLKMNVNYSKLAVSEMVDFRNSDFTQEVRLKANQLNMLLFAYFRSTCKTTFF